MATFDLTIENMHCGSCVRRVTQVLNALPATHAEEVRIGAARVQTDADPAQLEQSLQAAGFPARVQK
jgi:copper chaperone CopZ